MRTSSSPAEDGKAKQEQKLPRNYDNALVLMKSGNYQAAIPVLNVFIASKPGFAGPYLNLGIAYRLTGQEDAAADALNHALQLNPENPSVWHQLAILYRSQGDFSAALDAYRKALELDPNYALAHRNIGILYDLYLQQPALALEHYRKYLSLTDGEDTTVSGWVMDLERRSGSAQARTTP
ncbi:tetratricopeptide repeat protein [Thiogranum longum]|uniref:Tetratricopeptide repeat protein n=1 Tax=Thiogranum longum TaxID=1537524 RepID=A0A4R1HIM1_9GAMM|nr:tetratricopeptide repeat protein [Thiogranum longum]TCK17052.1 tetratricopeptide repeat protein [Thiogranum longum]